MIDSIRFVQRAVSSKKFNPVLTHFLIRNEQVKGFNGTLGLCGPIECQLDMAPNAAQFIRAINACEDTIALSESKGRLCVKSGKFRTFVDCVKLDEFPDIQPAGTIIRLVNPILPVLKKLEPFVATDASRAWSCGVLLRGQSAFATNNVALIECWLGYDFPHEVNIPHEAVRELIRIGDEPYALQFCEDRITFLFEEDRWLTTLVYALDWPDVYKVLDLSSNMNAQPIRPEFFDAVETLLPFTDDMNRIHLHPDHISTGTEELATTVAVVTPGAGIWNGHVLMALKGVTNTIDLTADKGAFFGDNIRGMIMAFRP